MKKQQQQREQLLLSREKCEHCYLLFQPPLSFPNPCPTKMQVSSEGDGKCQGDQMEYGKQDLGLPYNNPEPGGLVHVCLAQAMF